MGDNIRTYTAAEVEALLGRLRAVERDNEALSAENRALAADARDALLEASSSRAERDRAVAERDRAAEERDRAVAERDAAVSRARSLEAQVRALTDRILEANARLYAPKSERASKVAPGQLSLFNDAEAAAAGDDAGAPEGEGAAEAPGGRRARRAKRRIDWDTIELTTTVETVELPEGERACPECGAQMRPMGYDVTRTFTYVPAHVEVLETRVAKYVCEECSRANREDGGETPAVIVRTEAPAAPLPGTHASPSLLSHLIYSKYDLALPINRIWRDLDALGLPVGRQTLAGWVVSASLMWLGPLDDEIWREMRGLGVLQMDETTVQVLKEPGRRPESKSYMWVAVTSEWEEFGAVHFEYHPSRSREVERSMVEGFGGILETDGYVVYDSCGPGIANCRCLAHARRKFADTLKALGVAAAGSATSEAIARIRAVYREDGAVNGLFPAPEGDAGEWAAAKSRERCRRVLPLVVSLHKWAAGVRPECVEGSPLARALDYLMVTLDGMAPYFADGRVPIDNNRAERAVRPFAIGRANWLFSDTVAGAEASAHAYSVVQTARMNGLHPGRYVEWLLEELPKGLPSTAEGWRRFLPWSADVPGSCRLRGGEKAPDLGAPLVDVDPEALNPE